MVTVNSRFDYTADGTDTWAITFDFDTPSEVILKVDDTDQVQGVDYDVVGTDVVFKPAFIPVAPARIGGRRRSALDILAVFANKSTIDSAALDLMYTQLLRLAQEGRQDELDDLFNVSGLPSDGKTYMQYDTATKQIIFVNPIGDQTAIAVAAGGDTLLIADASDSNNLKKITMADLTTFFGATLVKSVNTKTGIVVLDPDDLSDAATTNKFTDAATQTKMGFIAVTQAVDLDVIESDTAANTAKVSYPAIDSTKVGFIAVTQAVDLDVIESDTAANTAKISYTDAAAVAANTLKVSNATHTGEVIGSGALTIDDSYITGKPVVIADPLDKLNIYDLSGATTAATTVQSIIDASVIGSTPQVATFSAVAGNYYTISGAANFNANLPIVHSLDERVSIYCAEAYTGTLTVDGNAGDTIDGDLTLLLTAGDYILIESDGTNWHIIVSKKHTAGTAGANQEIQYNDAGAAAGNPDLIYDKTKQEITLKGGLKDIGFSTQSTLTGTINDHTFTNLNKIGYSRLGGTSGSDVILTGFAGGTEGKLLTIINVGTDDLVFKNNDAGSGANNKLALPNSIDLRVGPQDAATFWYDVNQSPSAWRCIAVAQDDISTSPVQSVNTKTGIVVLDPDDLSDAATTNKFINAAQLAEIAANTLKISYTDAAAVAANTLKVTNATHSGEVTGSGALVLDKSAIQNKTNTLLADADELLFGQTASAGAFKKVTALNIRKYVTNGVDKEMQYNDGGSMAGAPEITFNKGKKLIDIKGGISQSGVDASTMGAGTNNDFALPNYNSTYLHNITATGAVIITGLSGGVTGKTIVIKNIGTGTITLTHADVLSTLVNRFALPSDADLIIGAGESAEVHYSNGLWYAIADTIAGSSVAGADTQLQYNDGGTMAGAVDLLYDKTKQELSIDGGIKITSQQALAIGASVFNDYALPNFDKTYIYPLSPAGPGGTTFTGFANGSTGKIIILRNLSSTISLFLNHVDAGSAVGNRFELPLSQNMEIKAQESVMLIHNGTAWYATTKYLKLSDESAPSLTADLNVANKKIAAGTADTIWMQLSGSTDASVFKITDFAGATLFEVRGDGHTQFTNRVSPATTNTVDLGSNSLKFKSIFATSLNASSLTFPAAAVPSTNVNALDDYEKGTFNPSIWDDTLSDAEGQTYAVRNGFYTKVGNRVFFHIYLVISSIGTLTTTQTARVGGLPFTSDNTGGNNFSSVNVGYGVGLSIGAGESLGGHVDTNAVHISLKKWDVATGTSNALISEITGGGNLMISGHYIV